MLIQVSSVLLQKELWLYTCLPKHEGSGEAFGNLKNYEEKTTAYRRVQTHDKETIAITYSFRVPLLLTYPDHHQTFVLRMLEILPGLLVVLILYLEG